MKYLLLPFLFFFHSARAQQVQLDIHFDQQPQGPARLLLLEGDGHYDVPVIELGQEQHIRRQIPLDGPQFAMIRSSDIEQRILLSPGRNLVVHFTGDTLKPVVFTGMAARENDWMLHSVRNNVAFFMAEDWPANRYVHVTVRSFYDSILEKIGSTLKSAEVKIVKSDLPPTLANLLNAEMRYAWQCYLNDFANTYLARAKNPARDSILQLVMDWQPMPDSGILSNGFYANMMLQRHSSEHINGVARQHAGSRELMNEAISNYLQTPFPTLDSMMRIHGQHAYLAWLDMKLHMPLAIREKFLYDKILETASDGDFQTTLLLNDTLGFYFPGGPYKIKAARIATSIRERLAVKPGARIIYREPGSIKTFADLIRPYAGKPIYLDLWGTWCGPCKLEMRSAPALRERFAGKDVVFFYLDMDKPEKEQTWKDYTRVFNLEGIHYRMSQQEIETIWAEVQKNGGPERQRYPTYVLIDRSGRIVNADAPEPSSGDKLYVELEKLL